MTHPNPSSECGITGCLRKGCCVHVGKAGLLQAQVAGGAAIDNAQFRQPDLMNARLEAAAQADRIAAIVDQREIVALIAVPLAEVVLCRRNGQRQQQDQADDAECPHRIAEERLPRRGKIFSYRLHLTPPGQDPGPAWAAEPCADSGEHNKFKKKPRHDPVSQRLLGQVAAQPRRRIRRAVGRDDHCQRNNHRGRDGDVDMEDQEERSAFPEPRDRTSASRLVRSFRKRPLASMLMLKYGMTIRAMMRSVGTSTPATTGGK